MGSFSTFLNNMDWTGLLMLLFSAAAALLCITFHELSHGFVAWKLGDPTAKLAGRLTLNPLRHLDPLGFVMMVLLHVGWAKPVPIDLRYFKNPRRDMALTALAGPASNFLLAAAALLVGRVLLFADIGGMAGVYALLGVMYIAVLSVGLGVFNLIPIAPLDGSKVLISFLPERLYRVVLRYERWGMLALLLLVWLGVLNGPLNFLMSWAVRGLCFVTGFPYYLFAGLFF